MKLILAVLIFLSTAAFVFPPEDKKASFPATDSRIMQEIVDRGKLYLQGGLYDKALKYFDGLIAQYPGCDFAYYYLGLAYYGKGDFTGAEEYLKKSIDRGVHVSDAYYHLSLIEHKRGNHARVIEYLEEVTLLDGTFQNAYYNKGVTFLELGMPARAVQEFAYALYLEPRDYSSFVGVVRAYEKMEMAPGGRSPMPENFPPDPVKAVSAGHAVIPEGPEPAEKIKPAPKMQKARGEPVAIYGPQKKKEIARPAAEKSLSAPDRSFAAYILTSAGKKEVDITDGREAEAVCSENLKGILEIIFSAPRDLRKKVIKLEIKGTAGNGKIKVILRDKSTRRSPPFYLKNIGRTWQPFSVNPAHIAYNLDLENVEYIKLEFMPPAENSETGRSAVFAVRNVRYE